MIDWSSSVENNFAIAVALLAELVGRANLLDRSLTLKSGQSLNHHPRNQYLTPVVGVGAVAVAAVVVVGVVVEVEEVNLVEFVAVVAVVVAMMVVIVAVFAVVTVITVENVK